MNDARVAVCVPVGNRPTWQFWRSLRRLRGVTEVHDRHGLEIAEARRQLTLSALGTTATHLLFIDDDMRFDEDALERLLVHGTLVVSGLCHSRRPPYQPTLARLAPESGPQGQPLYTFDYDYPRGQLVEVDATGAAFLLVKREVFERLGGEDWWASDEGLGEDFSFCRRVKAAGLRVLVDTAVEIGHVAEVVVDSKVATALRNAGRAAAPAPAPEARPAFVGNAARASIIIPTYNQNPRWLRAAVLSALGQSVPVEVIVVDDGTTEYRIVEHGTSVRAGDGSMVLPAGVKLLTHGRNLGISAALNSGIQRMSTEWFCWLSSDDLFEPNKVEKQLAGLLAAGAKCGFHDYGVKRVDGSETQYISHVPGAPWRDLDSQRVELVRTCVINGSTVMIHRDVFSKVGLFDEGYLYGQDWEFWCRVGEKFLWHVEPAYLGTRREGGNLTEALAADAPDAPRRKRRDAEDAMIRARYTTPRCRHCQEPL